MIQIQRTKFGIFDKFKSKPKNTNTYIQYKDEFYTCGKFTYPISIFLDILETVKEKEGCRYIARKEDGTYLLFIPPYEVPFRLKSLDKEVLNRLSLFSNGLETLNFDHTGLPKLDSKLIAIANKKMPKVISKYGFFYLGISIGIVYILAYTTVTLAIGLVEENLHERNLVKTELKTQLFGVNTKLDELKQQLGDGGEVSLSLPKPYETFLQRASRGERLEQENVITTPPPSKEEL